jgi:hypothetical protein
MKEGSLFKYDFLFILLNVDTSPCGPLSTLGIVGNPSMINGPPIFLGGGGIFHIFNLKKMILINTKDCCEKIAR